MAGNTGMGCLTREEQWMEAGQGSPVIGQRGPEKPAMAGLQPEGL